MFISGESGYQDKYRLLLSVRVDLQLVYFLHPQVAIELDY